LSRKFGYFLWDDVRKSLLWKEIKNFENLYFCF